jgi:hypothetical protein
MGQEPYSSDEERGRRDREREQGGLSSRRQIYALVGLFMVSVLVIGVVLAILSTGVGQGGGGTWWQKVSINHTPVTKSPLGSDIAITAHVIGFPKNVTLNYQIVPNNATTWSIRSIAPKTVFMLLLSAGGDQYSYTIQGTEVLGDITYYIAAADAYGNTAVSQQYKILVDDFAVQSSAKEMTVYVSTPATTTVYVTSFNAFNSPVSLRAITLGLTALPGGLAADFNPPVVTPPAGGTATSTLTIRSTSNQFVPSGIYYMEVQGLTGTSRGSFMRNGTVATLKVPDFDFTVSPSSQTVYRQVVNQIVEQITPFNLTITVQEGFESDLAFSSLGLPATGVGTRWVVAGADFHTTGTTVVTLQIVTDSSAQLGSYTLTIYVTGGGLQKFKQVSFVVLSSPQG